MAPRRKVRWAGWILGVVACAAGCGGTQGDGAGLAPDAVDGASGSGVDGPGPDGGGPGGSDAAAACLAGQACAAAVACQAGTTQCEGGQVSCVATAPLADGTPCGAGLECVGGACAEVCAPGLVRCGARCVDPAADAAHCGGCGQACDADAACDDGTCRAGAAAELAGACTLIDQPGWLSCPTGMSCRCYYRYDRVLEDAPATLAGWRSDLALEITGGALPSNSVLSTPPPELVPLSSVATPPQTGAAGPYRVTVSAAGVVDLELTASAGYVPPSHIITSSSDCGNRGQRLECRFAAP
jgi:hypothetical protein